MSFRRAARRSAALATLMIGIGLATAAPSFAVHQTAYGLTTEDPSRIVGFAVGTPGTVTGPSAITFPAGTPAADQDLIGIDYRPRSRPTRAP